MHASIISFQAYCASSTCIKKNKTKNSKLHTLLLYIHTHTAQVLALVFWRSNSSLLARAQQKNKTVKIVICYTQTHMRTHAIHTHTHTYARAQPRAIETWLACVYTRVNVTHFVNMRLHAFI